MRTRFINFMLTNTCFFRMIWFDILKQFLKVILLCTNVWMSPEKNLSFKGTYQPAVHGNPVAFSNRYMYRAVYFGAIEPGSEVLLLIGWLGRAHNNNDHEQWLADFTSFAIVCMNITCMKTVNSTCIKPVNRTCIKPVNSTCIKPNTVHVLSPLQYMY